MNHRTTTVLVAIAAVAATLLAAGTVAALGSDNFAFAHKRYSKTDSTFAYPRNGYMESRDNGITKVPYKQIIICITTGQNSPIQTGACTNAMNVGKPGDLIGRAGTFVPRDISTASQSGSAAPIMVSNTANQPAAAAPMKVSSNNLGGSYPSAAAPMHSSTTAGQAQSSMNAKEFTPVKFPFDVNN